jgi:hypothetical protein
MVMTKGEGDVTNTTELPYFKEPKPPEPAPPAFATQSTTGLGKTSIFVEEVANDRLHPRADGAKKMYTRPWGYLVPTHRLGENVADLFREESLDARVIRSREALSADGEPMCLNLEQVKLAVDFHAPIQETCCKGKDAKGKKWQCLFFGRCRYQAQFPDEAPDVFIAAHQMMFHAQKRFGQFAAIGVDESFWEAGLWGIGRRKTTGRSRSNKLPSARYQSTETTPAREWHTIIWYSCVGCWQSCYSGRVA